jgi:predicted small secreted protein
MSYDVSEVLMKKLILFLSLAMFMTSCGTAEGVMNGTGSVLEGMATDFRGLGYLFSR